MSIGTISWGPPRRRDRRTGGAGEEGGRWLRGAAFPRPLQQTSAPRRWGLRGVCARHADGRPCTGRAARAAGATPDEGAPPRTSGGMPRRARRATQPCGVGPPRGARSP
jgi:hypothetical protein